MVDELMTKLAVHWIHAIVAQAGGGQGGDGSLNIQSVWDFVIKGGLTMIPIGIVSLVALAVIVERLLVLRRQNVIPPGLLEKVSDLLNGPQADRAKAIEHCKSSGSPMGNVLATAIRNLDEPSEKIEKQVVETGQREVVRLRKRMRLLSALPQVATMLGLVGTVFGMIRTFQVVAASSEALGKTELLARGIYEAWTTTAAGLIVAIPVLIAYHVLQGRIDSTIVDMDTNAMEWMERHGSATPPSLARPVERPSQTDSTPLPVGALAAAT